MTPRPLLEFSAAALVRARGELVAATDGITNPITRDLLHRTIARHPDVSLVAEARRLDLTPSALSSAWTRQRLPHLIRVRDRVREHLLASVLAHPDISFLMASYEVGEANPQNAHHHIYRSTRRAVSDWRAVTTPTHTLAAWMALVAEHRAALNAFRLPVQRAVPVDVLALRRDERRHLAALADIRERLAREAA